MNLDARIDDLGPFNVALSQIYLVKKVFWIFNLLKKSLTSNINLFWYVGKISTYSFLTLPILS